MSRKLINVTNERRLNEEQYNDTGNEIELHVRGKRQENTHGFYVAIYEVANGHKTNPENSIVINGFLSSSRRGGLIATIPDGYYYLIGHESGHLIHTVYELRAV